MLKRLLPALGIAVALGALSANVSAGYSSFYVFGDSLSDSGNVFIASGGTEPVSPPYAQRYSNGPVAAERLGDRLGLPLSASLAGGNDFAFGGAQTGFDNLSPSLPGTGVRGQIGMFSGGGGTFSSSSLVMLWAGPNDFFASPSAATISSAMSNLYFAVGDLFALGARHILMPNMPDLGITPYGLGSGFSAGLSALTVGFNIALDNMIDTLEFHLSGLDIIEFDTFAYVNDVVANPASYGFTNVTAPCVMVACANPDQYLFWDGVHPTAAAHRMLGDALMATVPEPASIALMLVALLIMAPMLGRVRIR